MYSDPTPPPAPDYAAANKAGIETQAELLPMQLAVDRAARLGTSWTDPQTGKTYDFSGLGGDAALNQLDIDSQKQLMQAGADISRNLTQQQYQDLIGLLPQYNELNLQSQKDAYAASLDAGKQGMQNQYDMDLQYRPQFGDLQRSEDLKTYLQNLDLGEQGTRRMTDLQNELLPQVNAAGLDAQSEANRRSLESFRTNDPTRAALMDKLVSEAQSDLDAGSSLTPEQMRNMQQALRGAQASRGNIYGAGAAFDEGRMASEMGQNLQQQRRSNALAILQGSDVAPRMNAAGAVNPLMPNYQSAGAVQPNTPNFSATTTGGPNLNPVNVQGGNAMKYVNPGAGQDAANYTSNIWSTQAQIKSQQTNPWMAGLSLGLSGLGAAGALGWAPLAA